MGHITTPAIQALLQSNPFLQEVCLGCDGAGIDSDALLTTLAASCPQLRYLNIYQLKRYTQLGVVAITRSLTQLRTMVVKPDCDVINPLAQCLWQDRYCPGLKFSSENGLLPFWRIAFYHTSF